MSLNKIKRTKMSQDEFIDDIDELELDESDED